MHGTGSQLAEIADGHGGSRRASARRCSHLSSLHPDHTRSRGGRRPNRDRWQNCAPEISGAFTGDLSAEMLKDAGAAFIGRTFRTASTPWRDGGCAHHGEMPPRSRARRCPRDSVFIGRSNRRNGLYSSERDAREIRGDAIAASVGPHIFLRSRHPAARARDLERRGGASRGGAGSAAA
jgi:hypothetical protein